MKLKNLTYVYHSGRVNRYTSSRNYPEEFFYGLNSVKKHFENTDIIEFDNDLDSKLINLFSRFLRKISGLPFFLEKLISKNNFRKLINSNLIVLTNQRMGFSALPVLIITKLLKKQTSCVFIMGLYNVNTKKKIKLLMRQIFTYIFLLTIDKLIFLSEGEYEYSRTKYTKLKNKFSFIPFCIDTDFWKSSPNINKDTKDILFIGNDGMRDYKFVIELAKKMPEIQFTFITKKIQQADLLSDNVTLINGVWSEETLSDEDIKKLYENSALSIIPLHESLQPSGQSVALQSMSMGIPVLITRTEGFWEPKIFEHQKNIIFIKNNEIQAWEKQIVEIFENYEMSNLIASNARKLVTENNNLLKFNKKLDSIIFD